MAVTDSGATEAITAQLVTTSIADAPVDDDLPVEASETSPAEPKEDPIQVKEKRRLYIGNLPYSSTEADIKAALAGYDIESITVPPHRYIPDRNSGYAFVDLKTPEDAAKVVKEFEGKSIADRVVFIQLARAPSERRVTENGRGRGARRGRGRGGRTVASRHRPDNRSAEDGDSADKTAEAAPEQVAVEAPVEQSPTESPNSDENTAPNGSKKASRAKPVPKKRSQPRDGVPSTTTVFVANLSYSCNNEKLKEYFIEFSPESANVAIRRPHPSVVAKLAERGIKAKPRALGFGFVKFPNEDLQKKAIEAVNNKELDGRTISVRVAIDSQIENAEAEAAGEESAAAETTDSPVEASA